MSSNQGSGATPKRRVSERWDKTLNNAFTAHQAISEGGGRIGVLPEKGWRKRNMEFITGVWLPSLVTPRSGIELKPEFPDLKHDDIGLTWIGHASFLLQMGGKNILIDPNWAMWLSIVKRVKRPGLNIKDLPKIDLVLVTHAHFDHMHKKSLRAVADGQPIVVPHGCGPLVRRLGFGSVVELNYWESREFADLEVTLTPCQHWGARMVHDNHRGFGGFIIRRGERSVFHCGDSAYFDGFEEIGRRNIEIALMPIGAYDTPSGRAVHMNPEEAVRAFIELQARTMVPMHYGTFRLSREPVHEPQERLITEALRSEITEKVCVMTEGRCRVF